MSEAPDPEAGPDPDPNPPPPPAVLAMSLRRRFLHGAGWTLFGNVAASAIRLPAAILLARMLGRETYGELGMINSTVGTFEQLARFRLGMTTTRHVAQYRRKDPERAARILGLTSLGGLLLGGATCVALVLAAPWLAASALHRPALAPMLVLCAGLILLGGLQGPQNGALTGLEAFRATAIVGIAGGLVSTISRLGGAWWFGLEGVVVAMLLSSLVAWLVGARLLRIELARWSIRPAWRGCLRERDVLWNYSLPSTIGALMVGPAMWAAGALLVRREGGYEDLGVFNAAFQWQFVVNNVPLALGAALVPMVSAHAGEDRPRLDALNLLAGWGFTILVALPAILLPDVLQRLYGKDFAGSAFPSALALVMLFTCIEAYNAGIARKLQAMDLLWWGVAANSVWAAALIGATLALRDLGAAGLAGAYALAYALKTALFSTFHVRRGVAPARLMSSFEVLAIWAGLGCGALAWFGGIPLAGRVGMLVAIWIGCALAFARLARHGAGRSKGADRPEGT